MANTKTTKKSKFSAEDKKAYAAAKRAEQQEMLAQAVDAMTSEAGWLRYLSTRSKFHKYSFNNTILIALQMPEATKVAGAATWRKEFNRLVKKGEHGIIILAPMMIYAKDEAGNFITDSEGKKVIDRVWFKSVKVFDVSQTEGDPIPAAPELQVPEGESHEEYIYRAEVLWQSMGFTVDYDSLLDHEHRGSVDLQHKVVKVNGLFPVNSQVRTHIHELAHAIGGIDYAKYTRQQAEVIVESAAYVACRMVGLDTAGMSVPYIATWGAEASEDPKVALKIMKEFTQTIDTLVEKIVEGIS